MQLLKFSTGNAKLGKRLIFSLPAGYSCPWSRIPDLPEEVTP